MIKISQLFSTHMLLVQWTNYTFNKIDVLRVKEMDGVLE